ncbi:MAG: MFS transporter [Chloroflexota bacterium]|nr:MFS transporter [Chloroflexota bacterium]
MGVLAAYRRVLGNRALARLLFGEFVSSIGDWLYLVALLVLVWDQARDPVALGVIGAARIVPYIVLSVPAGMVADRFDRRLVLLTTDVARGIIMLFIVAAVTLDAPVEVTVALAILATCFSAFFSPAIGAYLPGLVRDESELGPANSAWSSLDNLAFFIGPAFAALLLGLGSLELAFVLNALTFGVVAFVLWRLPPGLPAGRAGTTADGEDGKGGMSVREMLAPIIRPLLGLGLVNVVDGFVFGGLGVITVVLAVEVFQAGEAGTGLLNSAIGVGGVAGALIAGVLVLRRRLGPPLLVGALALGAGVAVLGQVGDFSLALLAMAFAAAGALLLETVATTLFQRMVPDSVRGRTLGGMETASVVAYAAGSFVVPVLGAAQPQLVLLGCGVAMAVAGIAALPLLGRFAVQEPAIQPLVHRLAEVPLFAGLPPARLETAMRAATAMAMSDGDVITRQGDQADRFYVIDSGTVEVTQVAPNGGQAKLLRRMGEGEVFGEIGLLSGVPRTATVRAISAGRLVVLERDAFLELVSAGPGLTYRLLDLHRGATAPAGEGNPLGG